MALVANQVSPQGLPAPGLPARDVAVPNFADGGAQSATFGAKAGFGYSAPTGGTITLPTPTGSRKQISLALYGTGSTTLSGTISVGGATLSSYVTNGDQTLILTDADVTRGWV